MCFNKGFKSENSKVNLPLNSIQVDNYITNKGFIFRMWFDVVIL